MSERVLLTVHASGEIPEDALHALIFVCTQLAGDEAVVIHSRPVGDPDAGPVSLEFYVRSMT